MESLSLGSNASFFYEKQRKPFRKLNFGGNPIGHDGVVSLLYGLGAIGQIEEMSISHTNPFFHASRTFAEVIGSSIIS